MSHLRNVSKQALLERNKLPRAKPGGVLLGAANAQRGVYDTVKYMNALPATFEISAVGVSFHQEDIRLVGVGSFVDIEREYDNPYDANAFRICFDGRLLGHVPKVLAKRLANEGVVYLYGMINAVVGETISGLRIQASRAPHPGQSERKVAASASVVSGPDVLVRVSKRRVGVLVEEAGDWVSVLSDQGVTISYPRELVEMANA